MTNLQDNRCLEIDSNITFKMLPPHVIVKNYIENEELCNYEIYLIELINLSSYFQQLSSGEKYIRPNTESNGESDAISNRYSIDFKLLISQSIMEGKSIFSNSITKYGDEFYGVGSSKARKKKQMKCTNICQAIRYLSLEDLEVIELKQKRSFIEKDISSFLNLLKTKKNILCFYPYVFDYKGNYQEKEAVLEVVKAIYHDLKESLLYRQKYVGDFDTFITTLYKKNFIIIKMDSIGFELVDVVVTRKITAFDKLMSIDNF